MAAKDCRSGKTHVQVRLTCRQVESLFSAINTAGMLSAGRVRRHDAERDKDLLSAIDALERSSGLRQANANEWVLD